MLLFGLRNRNQGNAGGCENVFFPSPQTAQGKALSSCILCSLFNSLASLLTLNPLFLWLCVLTSLLFLLHLSTLWGSCVIKIYYGHGRWQNAAMVKPAIALIFSAYIFGNIAQLRDMASMKVTYFPSINNFLIRVMLLPVISSVCTWSVRCFLCNSMPGSCAPAFLLTLCETRPRLAEQVAGTMPMPCPRTAGHSAWHVL